MQSVHHAGIVPEQVDLVSSGVVRLTGHEEDYFIKLPDVALEEPLTAMCRPALTGPPAVRRLHT